MVANKSAMAWRVLGYLKKCDTTLKRSSIGFTSFSGKAIQRRIILTAHRCKRAVDDGTERACAIVGRAEEFQIAHRELVEPDKTVGFDARQVRDVANLLMVRSVQIVEHCASRHHAQPQVVHAEAFEVLHLEMFLQSVVRRLAGKDPVVLLLRVEFCAECRLKVAPLAVFVEHLFGCETAQQFFDIIERPLAHKKFARRNIEKRNARLLFDQMHRRQKVVLLDIQHIVVGRNAWRYQFGNPALHQFARQFWVFELVADTTRKPARTSFGR